MSVRALLLAAVVVLASTTYTTAAPQQALQRFWTEANCKGLVSVAISPPLHTVATDDCVPSTCTSNTEMSPAVSSDIVCIDTTVTDDHLATVLGKDQVYAEVDYYKSIDVSCTGAVSHRLYSLVSSAIDTPCLSLPGTTRSGVVTCDEDGHAALSVFFSAESRCQGKSMLMDLSQCKQPVGFASVVLTPSDVMGRCFVTSGGQASGESTSIMSMLGSFFLRLQQKNNDKPLSHQHIIAAAAHSVIQRNADVTTPGADGAHRMMHSRNLVGSAAVRRVRSPSFPETSSVVPTATATANPKPHPYFGAGNSGSPNVNPASPPPTPTTIPVAIDSANYRNCFAWDDVLGAVAGRTAVTSSNEDYCCSQVGFLSGIVGSNVANAVCNINQCQHQSTLTSFVFGTVVPADGDDCLLKCYAAGTGGPSGSGASPPASYVATDPQVYMGTRLTGQNIQIVLPKRSVALASTAKDAYILDDTTFIPTYQSGYVVKDSTHNFACIHEGTIPTGSSGTPEVCQLNGCGSLIDVSSGFLWTSETGGSTCYAGCYAYSP